MEYVEITITAVYAFSLMLIFLFSLGQLHLTGFYLRERRHTKGTESSTPERPVQWPMVTVQLPIYNEKYVATRLLEAVSNLDYPTSKLQIQVLDDSTDETSEILGNRIHQLRQGGMRIGHIRRKIREGFKAGALQKGLEQAEGDYIAIFDADFIPKPDFLQATIPHFDQANVGVVQTRWSYVNDDYSLLTKLQAFGLNAHFTIEQVGRAAAGSFINFNGTAGVWRRNCIEDAGGWASDTLTEDLDLSYRAQMRGWRFRYLEDTESPSELPVLMSAIKTQQYRWNKGAAESAVKNLGRLVGLTLPRRTKIHAALHLLNSSVFISLFVAAILSVPMLFIKDRNPDITWIFDLGMVFLLGFFAIGVFYWVASRRMFRQSTGTYFLKRFLPFLAISMGLSLHNALASLEGLFGRRTPFIRTPKFNIRSKDETWRSNSYINERISPVTWIEGVLALYFSFGIFYGLFTNDAGLLFFHSFLAIGFSAVFFYSLIPRLHARAT